MGRYQAIEGKMGEYVVIARRKGDKWYLGGMCGWGGKDVEIDLSKFLPEGKYLAKIVRDTINSDDIPRGLQNRDQESDFRHKIKAVDEKRRRFCGKVYAV